MRSYYYFLPPSLGFKRSIYFTLLFFLLVLHAIQGGGNFGRLSARFNYFTVSALTVRSRLALLFSLV